MLPGFVSAWTEADIHIDLAKLASMAGARLVHAPVTGLDADAGRLTVKGRPTLSFDVLSVNIGGEPDVSAIPGAAVHSIPVKPISNFRDLLSALTARATRNDLP